MFPLDDVIMRKLVKQSQHFIILPAGGLARRFTDTAMTDFQLRAYLHIYRKTSNLSRTKSQSLNVSCILLQLSSLNPLKPGIKLRMKM